ncbi:Arsenical resistance operon repressor [hydrothermal vent metagenome]|uniref:Arsenical resistance operon repressor n=1 Tax=hydrothermal vent metagenome TaxID=652676 RepID=A0A3B1BQ46_9ZZZZ
MCLTIYTDNHILHAMTEIEFYKQLADETRLRCLMLIFAENELCVCELTHALGLSQPKISRHLANLRQAGVLKDRREGQWIYYHLQKNLPAWVQQVIAKTAEGLHDSAPYAQDLDNLKSMAGRPGDACATLTTE